MPLIHKRPIEVAGHSSDTRLLVLPKTSAFLLREFIVYPRRNLIENESMAFRVEPKIMDVLTALAASQGDVLLREELIVTVWGNRPGGDERLTRAISKLRKIFRDDPQAPEFLETVPKRGYRLACAVEWAS